MAKSPQRARPGAVARALSKGLAEMGGLHLVGMKKDKRPPMVISSGIDQLDVISGIGGYTEGRIIMWHGMEGTLKTTAALHAMEVVQNLGGIAAMFDLECKLDTPYAERLGVDLKSLIRNDYLLRYIEDIFDKMEELIFKIREIDTDCPVLIVYDSMQSGSAKSEAKRAYNKDGYDGEAKAYTRCIRKILPVLAEHDIILMFISQVRMDIGNPVPGQQRIGVGRSCLHHATQVYQAKPPKADGKVVAGKGEDGEDKKVTNRIGNRVEVVCKKNQQAPPFQKCIIPMTFGQGVNRAADVLGAAAMVGIAVPLKKKGVWALDVEDGAEPVEIKGVKDLQEMIANDPEGFQRFRDRIRSRIGKAPARIDPAEAAKGEQLDGEPEVEETGDGES